MQSQNNNLDFSKHEFYVGIDVHKKSWNVTIRSNSIVLKTFSMNPESEGLKNYMEKNYPKGKYYSAYEAGFSGFNTHRELKQYGFNSIVVSPTDIPTSGKERVTKTDKVDSRKISRELENGNLKGIFIPSLLQQEIRSISRLRYQQVKKQTRIKNQIKSYLDFYGHKLPATPEMKRWSRKFIEYLQNLEFQYSMGKEQLEIYIEELLVIRNRIVQIMLSLKKHCTQYGLDKDIKLLRSVPGVGPITAVTIATEIIDINRFSNSEKFASYFGLVPSTNSSGEKERVLGLTFLFNSYIRSLIIEAAWISIRNDPALTLAFNNFSKRMSKQESIVRIAKKLLNRIYFVLKNNTEYVYAVVK